MRNQLLRDADWAGMAHSLEIRTPLVDATLFAEIAGLNASKLDMAAAPHLPLPSSILNRPKTGFYMPIREWLVRKNPDHSARSGVIADGRAMSILRLHRSVFRIVCVAPHSENDWCVLRTGIEPNHVRRYRNFPF